MKFRILELSLYEKYKDMIIEARGKCDIDG